MDENKLQKLIDVEYTVRNCCGNCVYGNIMNGKEFGLCDLLEYDHLKHTMGNRSLSINRYGLCNQGYKRKEGRDEWLGEYDQFQEPEPQGGISEVNT